MKVLVTGAGGFLGKRVVSTLLERGHKVRALVRPSTTLATTGRLSGAELVHADLRANKELEKLFEGVDVLVHLAATVRGSPESQFVGGAVCTERLLEAMRRVDSIRHVVLASSFAVYDWTATGKELTEESPLESIPYERDGYTVAKMWQERVAHRLTAESGLKMTVLRPGFIYGPGAAPVAGAGIKIGKVYFVVGPFTRLPLTHVDNCAAAFADAAEKGAEGTFNIVDDERISAWQYTSRLLGNPSNTLRFALPYTAGLVIAYMAQLTSRILFPPKGGKLPEILVPRRYRAVFRPLYFDNHRAKEILGWKCKKLFANGCDVI